MKHKNLFLSLLVSLSLLLCSCLSACTEEMQNNTGNNGGHEDNKNNAATALLHYSFDEDGGYSTKDSVSGESYNINYVFECKITT